MLRQNNEKVKDENNESFEQEQNDNSQNEIQSRDDEAFEQIDNILTQDDNKQSRQQILLTFKVNQLQKICSTLTSANKKLLDKIEELQEQSQNKNNNQTVFTDQYSDMQCDFIQIEDMIKEYRHGLNSYQEKVKQETINKNQQNTKLKHQIQQLKGQIKELFSSKQQTERINSNLEGKNEELIIQIESLQDTIKKLKKNEVKSYEWHSSSSRRNYHLENEQAGNQFDYSLELDTPLDFNSSVQIQLEKLITKLVKELEHERNLKKNTVIQIKRLQKDLFELETQVMEKNGKIHSLQMNALKKMKYSRQKNSQQNLHCSSNLRQHTKSRSKQMHSFNLMQLGDDEIEIKVEQKLIIASKIIDFYLKKMNKKDYKCFMPQGLMVCNWSEHNPQLAVIRKNKSINKQAEGQETQQGIIWNLGFIMDNLFMQKIDRDDTPSCESHIQLKVWNQINSILENSSGNQRARVLQLKKTVDQAIKMCCH